MRIVRITATGSLACVVLAFLGSATAEKVETKDDYLSLVHRIHPYETFEAGSKTTDAPEGLFSRKNYEIYTGILADEYRIKFTSEEMEAVAAFYESPLGKKFIAFHMKSEAWNTFWNKIQPSPSFWTCTMHPQIRVAKKRKCPICAMELIPIRKDGEEKGSNQRMKPDQ